MTNKEINEKYYNGELDNESLYMVLIPLFKNRCNYSLGNLIHNSAMREEVESAFYDVFHTMINTYDKEKNNNVVNYFWKYFGHKLRRLITEGDTKHNISYLLIRNNRNSKDNPIGIVTGDAYDIVIEVETCKDNRDGFSFEVNEILKKELTDREYEIVYRIFVVGEKQRDLQKSIKNFTKTYTLLRTKLKNSIKLRLALNINN